MSTKREVCFLIGRGGAIVWADASDSPSALPDSRSRWDAIWSLREELEVIAHSHPNGPAAFSQEDETTMEALDSALGREVQFYVIAPSVTVVRSGSETRRVQPEPWWAELMRVASGMKVNKEQ